MSTQHLDDMRAPDGPAFDAKIATKAHIMEIWRDNTEVLYKLKDANNQVIAVKRMKSQ